MATQKSKSAGQKAAQSAETVYKVAKAAKAIGTIAAGVSTAGVAAIAAVAMDKNVQKIVAFLIVFIFLLVIIFGYLITNLPVIIFGSGNGDFTDIGTSTSINTTISSEKTAVEDEMNNENNLINEEINQVAKSSSLSTTQVSNFSSEVSFSQTASSSSEFYSLDSSNSSMQYNIIDNYKTVSEYGFAIAISCYSSKFGNNENTSSSGFSSYIKDKLKSCFYYSTSISANTTTYTINYDENKIEDCFDLTSTQIKDAENYEKNLENLISNISYFNISTAQNIVITTDGLIGFIERHEGFVNTGYDSGDGYITIGYGHVEQPNESFTLLTPQQADTLLKSDITKYQKSVINEFSSCDLNQYQIDALTDFSYNMGQNCWGEASNLVTDIKSNAPADKIMTDFLSYDYCNGVEMSGLYNRRYDEWILFSQDNYDSDSNN